MNSVGDYFPLFIIIGIAMLSIALSVLVTTLYVKFIFWLRNKYKGRIR